MSALLQLLLVAGQYAILYGEGFAWGFSLGARWRIVQVAIVVPFSLYVFVPVLISPAWPDALVPGIVGFAPVAWVAFAVFNLGWGLLCYSGYRLGIRHRERPKEPEENRAWAPVLEFGRES
jgi:hypothetical protein